VKKRNRKQNFFDLYDLYDVSLSRCVWTSTLHRDQAQQVSLEWPKNWGRSLRHKHSLYG